MSLFRGVVTRPLPVTHTFYDDESVANATVGVSVRVLRLDGTVVTASTPATQPGGAGNPYAFPVAARPTVDTLVIEWTADSIGGAVVVERDFAEIASAYLFQLGESRNLDPVLDATRFPTARLKTVRMETEAELDRITGRSFVVKFGRAVLSGKGGRYLVLPHIGIRSLRAVSVGGTALSQPELAAASARSSGVLDRPYGSWPVGSDNVVAEYEYGEDFPPEDLKMAAMIRHRHRLTLTSSGIPDRAIQWTAADGGSYALSLPSGEKTGVATVDDAYERYTIDRGGFA